MTGEIRRFRIAEVITPPIIGVAMRFITSAPACEAGDHMIGSRPKRMAQTVIILGRIRSTAPSFTAAYRSPILFIRPGETVFVERVIKIEQHHHTGFSVQTSQSNEADPNRNAHIVTEQVKQPERSYQRERHRQQNNKRSSDRVSVHVDEHENNE